MKRKILEELKSWKHKSNRKPLVLRGARQVGKSYSLEDFGKSEFQDQGAAFHCIDFKEQTKYQQIFQAAHDPHEIIKMLQLENRCSIDLKKDLLILDEIQECPGAVSSLKYFEKHMKSLCVIAAGSHLGLMHSEESFPVGKVNFLSMFPMSFEEFLLAFDESLHHEFCCFSIQREQDFPVYLHNRLLEALRYYFFTGGLPEAVQCFVDGFRSGANDFIEAVREIQKELILGYQADFSKYSGTVNANHIHHVFSSIPMQLSLSHDEEVKKYKFTGIIPKQKGFERIQGPLGWLVQSRLCIKSFLVSKIAHPLLSFCRENRFKVYFFDVGLLHAMLKTPPAVILNDELGYYKGFVAENFVAQELFALSDQDLFCWHEGQAEVEFLVSQEDQLIPLEVKASKRSRRAKSLESYIHKYKPRMAFKLSSEPYKYNKERNFCRLPLFFCSKVFSNS